MARELHQPITVLLTTMPAAELALWEDVYSREFIGADRDYFAAAQVSAMIANYAGKARPDYVEPLSPSDLMPFTDTADESQELPDAGELAAKLNAVFGGIAARQKP